MVRTYETVLFDLDGTLIDSNQLIFESYHETLAEHGLPPVTDVDLAAGFGIPLRENLLRISPPNAPLEALVVTYTRINAAKHDRMVRAFDGIPEALTALSRAGVHLGVVTGKRRQYALRGLKVCRLDAFFEVVMGPEDYSKPKPHPEPVQEALQKMNRPVHTAAYVGDAPVDIRSGRAAKVAAIGVAWSSVARAVLEAEHPDFIVERPEDLIHLARPEPSNPPSAG